MKLRKKNSRVTHNDSRDIAFRPNIVKFDDFLGLLYPPSLSKKINKNRKGVFGRLRSSSFNLTSAR